jgi:formylglycine-generating enzyme required for sulfatase activity
MGTENIYYDSLTKSFQIKESYLPKQNESAYSDVTANVKSYYLTALGLCNLNGNVAEFISEGFAMGGSWKSDGYDVRNESKFNITSPSVEVGFRPVFSVKAK